MKNNTIIFALCLLFVSCSQQPNKKGEYVIKPIDQAKELRIKYKANGNIEYIQQYTGDKPDGLYLSFHDNQNPDNMAFLKNEKNNGTGLVFHKNGVLNNFGQYIEGEKNGWFYVFDKSGMLTGKREYINIKDKSYLNQWIEYSSDGAADKINSSYISLNTDKDTIQKGDEFRLSVCLEASYFKQYMIMIVGDFDEKFNLSQSAVCDTIKSVNYVASYNTKTYKHGKNILRGMVQEIKHSDDINTKFNIRKIYFTKEFYVN